MKKRIEKVVKLFDNIKENANGKRIALFSSYSIFFLGLILLVTFAAKTTVRPDQYEESKPLFFTLAVLNNNNYHFKYTINLDDYKYEYEGDKYCNFKKTIGQPLLIICQFKSYCIA